jgi:hypothetical protein
LLDGGEEVETDEEEGFFFNGFTNGLTNGNFNGLLIFYYFAIEHALVG